MLKTLTSCSALALFAFGGAIAHAQTADTSSDDNTTELQTITVSGGVNGTASLGPDATIVATDTTVGSKTNTDIIDLSAAVSVVTAKEMKERATSTVEDILSYTSSVSTGEYGSDNRYDWIRIRGFYSTGQATYRDGLPMRSYGYTGGIRVEPYGLERAEVLKGSTSTLFGLNTPGGMVNLVTKRPTEKAFGEVYGSGWDELGEGGVDVGGPIDKEGHWLYRFTAKGKKSARGADHTKDDRIYVAPALTWKPDDLTSVTLMADYYKRDGDSSHDVPYGSGIDPDTFLGEPDFDKMNTTERRVAYEFKHEFDNGLQFRQNASYSQSSLTYESVYGAQVDGSDRSAFAVWGKTKQFGIDNQVEYDTAIGSRFDSKTLAGFDFTHDETHEHRAQGTADGIDPYNPSYCGLSCIDLSYAYDADIDQSTRGAYLQEELTLDDKWILTLGGRYDHIYQRFSGAPQTDEAFTKKVGLTYKATDNISVYANYSESFNPVGNYTLTGAPKAQEGTQYEVGAKFRPDNINALFTVALFDLTQTNVPQQTSPGTYVYTQVGEVNVKGVELEGKLALTDRLNLTAAYSYWDAEVTDGGGEGTTGNRPILTPKQIASIWADYTIPGQGVFGDLTLGAGVRYTGSTYADSDNTLRIKSRTLMDAAATYHIDEHASFSLNATNVFDRRTIANIDTYNDGAYYSEGRTVMGTLRYTW